VLIGERPGLSSPEFRWGLILRKNPARAKTNCAATVLSNVRLAGAIAEPCRRRGLPICMLRPKSAEHIGGRAEAILCPAIGGCGGDSFLSPPRTNKRREVDAPLCWP